MLNSGVPLTIIVVERFLWGKGRGDMDCDDAKAGGERWF